MTEVYRAKIADLAAALSDPSVKLEATEALRGLISGIRMIPDAEAPGGHHIELEGELVAIMALGSAGNATGPQSAKVRSGTVVAGN